MAAAVAAIAARLGACGRALLLRTPLPRLAQYRTCTPEQMRAAAARAAQINKTKEQLFDMVHGHVSSAHDVPHKTDRRYLLLMQLLSSQIKPRPNDPVWRVCRRTERCNTFFKFLGVGTSGILGVIGIHALLTRVDPQPKKLVADWWNNVTS
ncbi:hypothetical protein VPH35_017618 [Triticum aestivum]|uniref:Uncharacterized protein n=1 Tax=Aegilops tauschii TaxID=37682 RepID=M8AH44_AEGTA|nr:uncharacterized protein LOC123179718 [Triticum aestivum]